MSSPYSALASKIRAKNPGAYDDLSDDDLGKKIIAKFPQYQDLVKPNVNAKPSASPFAMIGEGEEAAATGQAEVGRQYVQSGPKEVGGGVKDIFSGNVPEGIHRTYKGAMTTAAPVAISAGPLALMEAPAATLTGLAAGQVAKPALKYGSKYLGASDPWAEVFGDIGEAAGSYFGAKGGKAVSDFLNKYHLTHTDELKLPFGFKLKRKPQFEPPPAPEDVEYQRQKTLTEAQEAAQKEKGQREAAAQRQSERAAKAQERAYNKDAEERMAIQKRADEAEAARAAAEKEAKNARFKSDQAHAKELADAEKARQTEITARAKVKQIQDRMDESAREQREAAGKRRFEADAAQEKFYQDQQDSLKSQMEQAEKEANEAAAQKERLRTKHGDDLMRRQKEQDALDKAAQKAADEEQAAKGAVKKLPPERPGGGFGGRPVASERFLTNLTKKSVLTPDDDAQGRQFFGKEWAPKPGEGHQARVTRLLGWVRGGRSARGMRDISIGPIPPPPEPPTQSP